MKGLIITFEGIDGTGKTTQIARLARRLEEKGFPAVVLREPGGSVISEKIRALLLDARNTGMVPLAEAMLYASARAQMVEEILKPLLVNGKIILVDRFIDSTIAYQGYGRGLDIDSLHNLNHLATGGLEPDLTILLDLEPAKASGRLEGTPSDRLEQEGLGFQNKVREGYLQLAASLKRIQIVDSSPGPEDVTARIEEILRPLLEEWADGKDKS
ncbi:MAG: dTMP kinase [Chitinophagales bacterium]